MPSQSPRKVHFFQSFSTPPHDKFTAVEYDGALSAGYVEKLEGLIGGKYLNLDDIQLRSGNPFVGPKTERITPFSTNAVEGARNIGLVGITRIEEYFERDPNPEIDGMLQRLYPALSQTQFTVNKSPEDIREIDDLEKYNADEGLALSPDEIVYLNGLAEKLGRRLTDSEVFGFSQVNSEHCRHKIFNGKFIIDGIEQSETLFDMIKETTAKNPGRVVSAYVDNAAANEGPNIMQWAPNENRVFELIPIETVVTLKAETHNFPTTVEPYNGAGTGTGGEIRDRLCHGKGSIPLAGAAVYVTSYPRVGEKLMPWEPAPRKWLYQTPQQILTKASDGASYFGNTFGQPMIGGKAFTFEHEENNRKLAYDKVIMEAAGVGYANARDAYKDEKEIKPGQRIILLGGDNQRIGMGGGAVSSLDTGDAKSAVELNAVQRANPEMQKRDANVIRTLTERTRNLIISIHDHGAGGHFNCLSELIKPLGGFIDMSKLPVGDETLSAREIIGNESQERMAILVDEADVDLVMQISEREQCPAYDIGYITGDMRIVFQQADGTRPIDMAVDDLFGKPPKTTIVDNTVETEYAPIQYDDTNFVDYLHNVLRLHGVGSKDWLTNKVDRSVTGRVAQQQCVGELQLPLSDYGLVKLDYDSPDAISSALGMAPVAGLIDPGAGSRLAIARALTNSIMIPFKNGLADISLSANWMWPCKNPGEDARLYAAVQAARKFAIDLGINIPTGKDSLSMTQKYPNGDKVMAPGTVVIYAVGTTPDSDKAVKPVMDRDESTSLYHIDFSGFIPSLGGSSFAQTMGAVGNDAPDVASPTVFKNTYAAVQEMVKRGLILSGHDISEGGLITTLLEMTFANTTGGIDIDLDYADRNRKEKADMCRTMFSENPGIVVQIDSAKAQEFWNILREHGVDHTTRYIGAPSFDRNLSIIKDGVKTDLDIDELRDVWMTPSLEMEKHQNAKAADRANLLYQPIKIETQGLKTVWIKKDGLYKPMAAILRDKGTNGDPEMAYAAQLGGFIVKDIATTDLTTGREDLKDIDLLIFCGGFSNSDVFGAGKIWADTLKYNLRAVEALQNFYGRNGTLSLGVCNGCQVMMELGLIGERAPMQHNESGKFESAFVSAYVPKSESVMLSGLSGMTLPIWVAHGEGRFANLQEGSYKKVLQYAYENYPGNPNGSPERIAGIASIDGRHVAMMPHPERAVLPYQWAYNPREKFASCDLPIVGKPTRKVMPWVQMFAAAHNQLAY